MVLWGEFFGVFGFRIMAFGRKSLLMRNVIFSFRFFIVRLLLIFLFGASIFIRLHFSGFELDFD